MFYLNPLTCEYSNGSFHSMRCFLMTPCGKLSFKENVHALICSDQQATEWFVSFNALILDDPMWEIILKEKLSALNSKNMGMVPNKCNTFSSNLI